MSIHSQEWLLKIKKGKITNVATMCGNWNPCTLLVGMSNDSVVVGKSLAVPQKVKRRIVTWPSNSTSKYKPRRLENRYSNESLYWNVHSSTTHNSHKGETTWMSFRGWMGKWIAVIHTVGHKKKRSNDTHYNTHGPPKRSAQEKPAQRPQVVRFYFHKIPRIGKSKHCFFIALILEGQLSWMEKKPPSVHPVRFLIRVFHCCLLLCKLLFRNLRPTTFSL